MGKILMSKILKLSFLLTIFLEWNGQTGAASPPIVSDELLESANFFKKAEEFKLANGMQFVVLPNHRSPVITQRLLYKVGSADEPAGKSGIAHLLEHIMFLGTHNHKGKEFGNAQGPDNNAYTNHDETVYELTFSKEKLERIFALEADRMVNLKFDPVAVENEKRIVREEYLYRIENNSAGKLWQTLLSALFWVHPYKLHPCGWPHELTNASIEDLQQFYKKWYTPSNSICVLAGDITLSQAKELAEKYYGKISAQDVPLRQRPTEPEHFKSTLTLDFEHEKDKGGHSVSVIYPLPSFQQDYKKLIIFNLLTSYLAGSIDSLLYRKLVSNQKSADTISIDYDSKIDPNFVCISASPKIFDKKKVLSESIMAELKNFLAEGVNETELEHVKKRLLINTIVEQENFTTLAEILVANLGNGYSLNQLSELSNIIKNITSADVLAMAKEIFRNPPRLIVMEKPYNPSTQDDA